MNQRDVIFKVQIGLYNYDICIKLTKSKNDTIIKGNHEGLKMSFVFNFKDHSPNSIQSFLAEQNYSHKPVTSDKSSNNNYT